MKILYLFVTVGIIGLSFCIEDYNRHGVRIVSDRGGPSGKFTLNIDELKRLLETEEIKDRQVVVVSITGAFRKGKSFILNFFLEYLYAQYKNHRVYNWLGEDTPGKKVYDGFVYRSGQEAETNGIVIWPEIFTHDYENGTKVAIILMDTQGIFDTHTSTQKSTALFSLSELLSSVQIFNLKEDIKEDDLQHLQFFTEYALLVSGRIDGKPLQRLYFLVRDWPYAYEADYGSAEGQKKVDKVLKETSERTSDMNLLRQRIKGSFSSIHGFLMPHPGYTVSNTKFGGNLNEIDPLFLRYVKEFTEEIFAPKNLVIRSIFGKPLSAKEWIIYFQKYIEVLNGSEMPQAKSLVEATAASYNEVLLGKFLLDYSQNMNALLHTTEKFLSDDEMVKKHEHFKRDSLTKFDNERKYGGEELASSCRTRLVNSIEAVYHEVAAQYRDIKKRYKDKAAWDEERRKVCADVGIAGGAGGAAFGVSAGLGIGTAILPGVGSVLGALFGGLLGGAAVGGGLSAACPSFAQ